MWRFILGIIFLLGASWLGVKIAEDPGLALFSYKNWSMEMPLWFAVVCLLFGTFIIYCLVHMLDKLDTSLYRWQHWLYWRHKNKSYRKTHRGLLELIEGHWRKAETYLLTDIAHCDQPLINYLAAAKAAHEQAEYDKRDAYLRKAHDLAPQADIAIGLTQAQLQFNQGQLEQALATLNHLRALTATHPVVLQLLQRVYLQLGEWENLLKLIPALRKAKLLTAEQIEQLMREIYLQILRMSSEKKELQALQTCWHALPSRWQKDPRLVSCYAQHLMHYPATAVEIEELINKTVKKNWDAELVRMYGLISSPQPKKQLLTAESWLKIHANHAVLLLTLARLSMRCQLWGKARNYLQNSLKLAINPEVYVEYGKLFEQLGDTQAAVQNYREGLMLLTQLKLTPENVVTHS